MGCVDKDLTNYKLSVCPITRKPLGEKYVHRSCIYEGKIWIFACCETSVSDQAVREQEDLIRLAQKAANRVGMNSLPCPMCRTENPLRYRNITLESLIRDFTGDKDQLDQEIARVILQGETKRDREVEKETKKLEISQMHTKKIDQIIVRYQSSDEWRSRFRQEERGFVVSRVCGILEAAPTRVKQLLDCLHLGPSGYTRLRVKAAIDVEAAEFVRSNHIKGGTISFKKLGRLRRMCLTAGSAYAELNNRLFQQFIEEEAEQKARDADLRDLRKAHRERMEDLRRERVGHLGPAHVEDKPLPEEDFSSAAGEEQRVSEVREGGSLVSTTPPSAEEERVAFSERPAAEERGVSNGSVVYPPSFQGESSPVLDRVSASLAVGIGKRPTGLATNTITVDNVPQDNPPPHLPNREKRTILGALVRMLRKFFMFCHFLFLSAVKSAPLFAVMNVSV